MKERYILFLILGLDALILFLQIPGLSISRYEASLLYGDYSFLQSIIEKSIYLFGQNDFALRAPMIIFHLLSALLLYNISMKYTKSQRDRLWLILIFILLPGVISSAIIVDSAGLLIFGLLFFIYMYENYSKQYIYFLLIAYLFVDYNFLYLFLALCLFSIYAKQKYFLIFNILLLIGSIFLYGLNMHGSPKGHFLDAIGIYAAIFTPIIFIYLFYILYRRYLTKEIDLLWFISATAMLVSLLLSFRQKIEIEHFAPYIMMALPLGAETFSHSYRVRLKIFRNKYKTIFIVSLFFLFLNSFLVFFNKELYLIIENPKKHFAYKMHVAKELASQLKSKGITCVKTNNNMSRRLKFYGVTKCNTYILSEKQFKQNKNYDVTISYKKRPVYFADVTKVNTQ